MADLIPKKKSETPVGQSKTRKPFFEAIGILAVVVLVILLSLAWIFRQFNEQLTVCMSEKAEYVNKCTAANAKIATEMATLQNDLASARYDVSVADQRCSVGMKSLQESVAQKNELLEQQKVKIEELQWEVNRLKNELQSP